MRSLCSRLVAVTMLAGVATLAVGVAAAPVEASPLTDCTAHLADSQNGSLAVTSTESQSVAVGSNVHLSTTWNGNDFTEKAQTLLVCTTVDGTFNPALSSAETVLGGDAASSATLTVPADLPAGHDLCVREVLVGNLANHTPGSQTSNQLCFTAAAAPETTTTTAAAPVTTTTTVATPPTTAAAPVVAQPAPAVAPAGTSQPAPAPAPQLPRTGAPIDVVAGLGGCFIVIGQTGRRLGRRLARHQLNH